MNYFSKLFSTGAIRETPKKVIRTLSQATGSKQAKTIIEIGAGKGELSAILLEKKQPTYYYAFEIDDAACQRLKTNFPQITLLNEDAFNFQAHIAANEKIDLFLSSIPLSFYSKSKIKHLLDQAKNSLDTDGRIIIIFTAFWLIPILKRELPGARLCPFFTFPPYFLLVYQRS